MDRGSDSKHRDARGQSGRVGGICDFDGGDGGKYGRFASVELHIY